MDLHLATRAFALQSRYSVQNWSSAQFLKGMLTNYNPVSSLTWRQGNATEISSMFHHTSGILHQVVIPEALVYFYYLKLSLKCTV
eukprot:5185987-Amphidinium_carterae.1